MLLSPRSGGVYASSASHQTPYTLAVSGDRTGRFCPLHRPEFRVHAPQCFAWEPRGESDCPARSHRFVPKRPRQCAALHLGCGPSDTKPPKVNCSSEHLNTGNHARDLALSDTCRLRSEPIGQRCQTEGACYWFRTLGSRRAASMPRGGVLLLSSERVASGARDAWLHQPGGEAGRDRRPAYSRLSPWTPSPPSTGVVPKRERGERNCIARPALPPLRLSPRSPALGRSLPAAQRLAARSA